MRPTTDDQGDDHGERTPDDDLFGLDTFAKGVLDAELFSRMFGEPSLDLLKTLGRYQILRQLGAGGMGVVYLAHDPELDRHVALKLLRASQDDSAVPVADRTRAEARAMARLTHPNVVHVYDVGQHGRHEFIAMEYVKGTTLRAWLADHDASWRDTLAAFVDAGQGLAAAHAASLVHRDFKPDNVLVRDDGVVKVTDFGIAKRIDPRGENASAGTAAPAGTLLYMSPEQVAGEPIDAQSDQFSFCVALHEALLGEHPFATESVGALTLALVDGTRRPIPARSGIPTWVLNAMSRGLSRRPEQRWGSMTDLLDVLRRDPAVARRRWLGAAGVVVAAGVAAFIAGRGANSEPCDAGPTLASQTWNNDKQRLVQGRFDELALPYSDASFRVVGQRMQVWVTDWGASYVELCRARHEQSPARYGLRMDCLGRQRDQTEAFVALLTTASPSLVTQIPDIVDELPQPWACSNAQALDDIEPPNADVAEAVSLARERLARIEAQLMTLQSDGLVSPLQALQDEADVLAYRPLIAEVQFARARLASGQADAAGSRKLLLRAHAEALATRHEELALRTANELLFSESAHPDPHVAQYAREQWNSIAAGLSERLGRPVDAEIERRTTYIRALRQHDQTREISEHTQAAMEFIRATIGEDDPRAAKILEQHANAQLAAGEPEDALRTLDQVDALYDEWLGPDHPHRRSALLFRLHVLRALGRLDDAVAVADRVVQMHLDAFGPDHPDTRHMYGHLATALGMRGEHERARAVFETIFGGVAPDAATLGRRTAKDAHAYCSTLVALREFEMARSVCEPALVAAARLWPHGSQLTARILSELAAIARATSDPEGGLALDRRALALCERLDRPPPRATAAALVGIGQGLLALGRPHQAVGALKRAAGLQGHGPRLPEHAEVACLLARAHSESAPLLRADARRRGVDALERLSAAGPHWSTQADACAAWMARGAPFPATTQQE